MFDLRIDMDGLRTSVAIMRTGMYKMIIAMDGLIILLKRLTTPCMYPYTTW